MFTQFYMSENWLTLYSCPNRMVLCTNYQRRIVWVWFSCGYTGGLLEHNVAHFETLKVQEKSKQY